jgi:gluconolactonase
MSHPSWTKRISIIAGAFAVIASAGAQQATADTSITPAIKGVVAAGTKIELIKEGFNGTEGPLALPDGSLIFSETPANRITRIAADGSTSSFLENTNGSNGLAFAKNGDLYSVQVLNPKVGIVYPESKAKVLADQYEGLPFARPNDIVLDKKAVFTSPTPAITVRPNRIKPRLPNLRCITSPRPAR